VSASARVDPRFLSVAQAAVALGVSGPTIRRWVAEQRLGAVQVGGHDGVLRIPLDVIEQLVADARQDAAP
jgi:excisionase family DNA binding protein